jgi:hypothetical protein
VELLFQHPAGRHQAEILAFHRPALLLLSAPLTIRLPENLDAADLGLTGGAAREGDDDVAVGVG